MARREKDAAEASLRDVQEDLEDSNELVTQQTLTTDIWQGRFDELFELARAAGVDGNTYRKSDTEILLAVAKFDVGGSSS